MNTDAQSTTDAAPHSDEIPDETSEFPVPGTSTRSSNLPTIVLSLVALVLGAGVFMALAAMKEPPIERLVEARLLNVEVFTVRATSADEIVIGFGTARADRTVTVSAQVAGEVVWVSPKLEVGESVRAAAVRGETTLDPRNRFLASERQDADPVEAAARVVELIAGTIGSGGFGQIPATLGVSSGVISTIEPGQMLVQIDSRSYRRKVEQLQAQLSESETELNRLYQEQFNNARLLAKAKTDHVMVQGEVERVRKLIAGTVATEAQLTTQLLELRRYEDSMLQRQLEAGLYPLRIELTNRKRQSQATSLQLADLDLARTTVMPPFHATLSNVSVEHGQFVTVGQPLFELTDTSRVEIAVPVRLSEHAQLDRLLVAGERPNVEFYNRDGGKTRWRGFVARAAPVADRVTRTVEVFIEVRNAGSTDPLLPGTFVEAHIHAASLTNQIIVPRDAIIDGHVFVADSSNVARRRPVEVVRTMQTEAAVSGLESGDRVVLTNLDVIHDGVKLSIIDQN
ncbi:MAG: efflux RND transporter periplasmic adaptor subunit [Planctomycetota bacterium]|nr:efflux RND transporter periplasmic adaptor subunit [Planctomycetota bacterium]